MADENKEVEVKMTTNQLRFVEEYTQDFNATQAAKRAGYSEDSCRQIGSENLSKPYIREAIDARLRLLSLTADETLKSISDIAKGDLKPYFTARQQIVTPKVSITLAEYIDRKKEEMENEEYIHQLSLADGLLGHGEELDSEIERFKADQLRRKRELVRLEVRLVKDPGAMMIVDGEPKLIETAELDVAKLVKDKEAGKIKSFQMTNAGAKVELYDADAALSNLAKYHGLFEKDNQQKTFNLNVGFGSDDD